MNEVVKYEIRDGIVWLRLDRPEKLNALNLEGWNGITDGLARAAVESRAPVVLTGTGRAFCAGDDIASFEILSKDSSLAEEFFLKGLYRAIEAIITHPTPVIAAVNGLAHGGGLELVAASDLAVSAESAEFCIPEGRIGAFAAVFVGLAPTLLGFKEANDFAYRMARLLPQDALQLGLVNSVVPDAQLGIAVDKLVREILAGSPDSISSTKRFLAAEARERGLPRVKAALQSLVDDVLNTPDLAEGTNAFLEKRRPVFDR